MAQVTPVSSLVTQPGAKNIFSLTGLTTRTLYAIVARGTRADTTLTSFKVAANPGSVPSDTQLSDVSTAGQAIITSLTADYGVSPVYPNSFVVAGYDGLVTASGAPRWRIDYSHSNSGLIVAQVYYPNFQEAPPSTVISVHMEVSTDERVSWTETINTAPAASNPVATFSIGRYFYKNMYFRFRVKLPDGFTLYSRMGFIHGIDKSSYGALPPIINSLSGIYEDNTLNITAELNPDPKCDSVRIEVSDADNPTKVLGSRTLPMTTWSNAFPITATGLAKVNNYRIRAYSILQGSPSEPTEATLSFTAITESEPVNFNPADLVILEEITKNTDTTKTSRISVDVSAAITSFKTAGIVYLRDKTAGGGIPATTISEFDKVGQTSTKIISAPVTLSHVYEIFVAALTTDGREAPFNAGQVTLLTVTQFGTYYPVAQTPPLLTLLADGTLKVEGTYTRPIDTPEPSKVRLYSSQTSISSTYLVQEVEYATGGSTGYHYTVLIPTITPFWSVADNAYMITIRTLLDIGTLSADVGSTVCKITPAASSAPTITGGSVNFATAKMVVTVTDASFSMGAGSAYIPSNGGNGIQHTYTPGVTGLEFDVRDAGATFPGSFGNYQIVPGLGFDLVSTNTYWSTIAPANNNGSKDVRARTTSTFGAGAWSSLYNLNFPALVVSDTTQPDLTPCTPRFTPQSDGSVKLVWYPATFGSSGLGAYIIKRHTANTYADSIVIATPTPPELDYQSGGTTYDQYHFVDAIPIDKVGTTYYYWLQAISGAGLSAAAAVQYKLSTDGITPGCVTIDSSPAAPASITAVGVPGGIEVQWTAGTELDLYAYELETCPDRTVGSPSWSLLARTDGNVYVHSGLMAATATVSNYGYRVRAVDRNSNASGYTAVSTITTTNYIPFGGTAPTVPGSATISTSSDGGITLSISASTDPLRTQYRVVRYKNTSTFGQPDGSGTQAIDGEVLLPGASNSVIHIDTGLDTTMFYNYRVYARSITGIDSATYAYPATSVKPIDTTAPAAPTLTATPQTGSKLLTIQAPKEANVTVELWRSTGATFSSGTAVKVYSAKNGANITAGSANADVTYYYVDAEADPGIATTHSYNSKAIDASGNDSGFGTASNNVTSVAISNNTNVVTANLLRLGSFKGMVLSTNAYTTDGITSVYDATQRSYWEPYHVSQNGSTDFTNYTIETDSTAPSGRYLKLRYRVSSGGFDVGLVPQDSGSITKQPTISLEATKEYVFSCFVKSDSGSVGSISFVAPAGVTVIGAADSAPSSGTISTTQYTRYGVKIKATTGSVTNPKLLWKITPPATGITYAARFAGVMLQEGTVLTPYTDHGLDAIQTSGIPFIDPTNVQQMVASGAMTTDVLVITNMDNLIPNPNSERQGYVTTQPEGKFLDSGWNYTTGSGYSRKLTNGQSGYITNKIPIPNDASIYLEARIKTANSSGGTAGTAAYMELTYFNASDTIVQQDRSNLSIGIVTGTLVTVTTLGTSLPSDTSYFKVQLVNNSGGTCYFDNFYCRRMNEGKLIVDGSITTNHVNAAGISAGVIKTGTLDASLITVTNLSATSITAGTLNVDRINAGTMTFDKLTNGSWDMGNAQIIKSNNFAAGTSTVTAVGFKMWAAPPTNNATLKGGTTATVSGEFGANLSIGGYLIGDVTARALNALDATSYTAGSNFLTFYKGNNDQGTLGGAPNINQLTITRRRWDTTNKIARLELKLHRAAITDNLEGMRFAKITLYRQSGTGGTGTGSVTTIGTYYVPVTDVMYVSTTLTDASNDTFTTFETNDSGVSSGVPACEVTLYNAYGPSATHNFYADTGNADGSALVDNGTSNSCWTSGGSSGGSGGGSGGGGGACVVPGTWICIGPNNWNKVDNLEVGDLVYTIPEDYLAPDYYKITYKEYAENKIYTVHFSDGGRLTGSINHRLRLANGTWKEIQDLQPDSIVAPYGKRVVKVEYSGISTVVKLTIKDAHTYISNGVLSHNLKRLD